MSMRRDEAVISMMHEFDAVSGTWVVHLRVMGLPTEHHARDAEAFLQKALCGDEIKVNG